MSTATLIHHEPVAIDPMAVFLSPAAYRIWLLIHHPNEPPGDPDVRGIKDLFAKLTPEQAKAVKAQVETFRAFVQTFDKAGVATR